MSFERALIATMHLLGEPEDAIVAALAEPSSEARVLLAALTRGSREARALALAQALLPIARELEARRFG